jgi:hypothetical protein
MPAGTTSHDVAAEEDRLQSRIRTLSNEVWEGTVDGADVERWLGNFDGRVLGPEKERLHALHLLANFDFFGVKEVREMLKSVFRDLYRYPLIQQARKDSGFTRDFVSLETIFRQELAATRFLGMGNPSESGAHLLYYFRQVNRLSKSLFIHQHEILEKAPGVPNNSIAIPNLKRLVFIDDLMGSGEQATSYSTKLLDFVREAAKTHGPGLEIWYFTLFARPQALDAVRKLPFDRVDAVHEVDDAEKAFSADSRVYRDPALDVSLSDALAFASVYGALLVPGHPLGYKDGQLLLGFHHNVPDNSLPIFWINETSIQWEPVFPRFSKVY